VPHCQTSTLGAGRQDEVGVGDHVAGAFGRDRRQSRATQLLVLLDPFEPQLRGHRLRLEVQVTGGRVDAELVVQRAVRREQLIGQVVPERLDPV
jgi:hypothetical protein